jgi:hypothetical protein
VWQLLQTATFRSFTVNSLWPCTDVRYSAAWSMRSCGLYRFMNSASEWHLPQTAGIFWRAGTPMNPLAGSIAFMPASRGSPPWQSADVNPLDW